MTSVFWSHTEKQKAFTILNLVILHTIRILIKECGRKITTLRSPRYQDLTSRACFLRNPPKGRVCELSKQGSEPRKEALGARCPEILPRVQEEGCSGACVGTPQSDSSVQAWTATRLHWSRWPRPPGGERSRKTIKCNIQFYSKLPWKVVKNYGKNEWSLWN